MNKAIRTLVVAGLAASGLATLTLTPIPASAFQNAEVRIQTRLSGGPLNGVTPSGSARFRARGAHSNFSVEVEDVNLPNGTVLTVTLVNASGTASAGTIALSLRGGEIDVNTKDGDTVPRAKAGDTVVVSGPSGAILSGVLR